MINHRRFTDPSLPADLVFQCLRAHNRHDEAQGYIDTLVAAGDLVRRGSEVVVGDDAPAWEVNGLHCLVALLNRLAVCRRYLEIVR